VGGSDWAAPTREWKLPLQPASRPNACNITATWTLRPPEDLDSCAEPPPSWDAASARPWRSPSASRILTSLGPRPGSTAGVPSATDDPTSSWHQRAWRSWILARSLTASGLRSTPWRTIPCNSRLPASPRCTALAACEPHAAGLSQLRCCTRNTHAADCTACAHW
jgi:hypothetical protein